jgi:hypothetical protein
MAVSLKKQLFARFKLVVNWDNSVFEHLCHDRDEVLSWMGMYPCDAKIAVIRRGTGLIIATRGDVHGKL